MSSHGPSLTAAERSICEAIRARDAQMRADLAAHVAIPTGWNHTAGLNEYRAILEERLLALRAVARAVPGEPKPAWISPSGARGSESGGAGDIPPTLVLRRERPGRPRILIACHLDTVFDPAGAFRAMTIAPDGKKAVGPGVVDMKGGALIAVNALEALEDAGADVSWTLLLNSDEETGSFHSAGALRAEARRNDVGLCTEPALPDGSLAIARMGSGQFKIEAFGRAAHVGRDFASGVSAVTALARAVAAAGDIADASRGRIVNIGPLKGGGATNVVPDHAAAWGNVRFPDAGIADELVEMLDALQVHPDDAAALPRVVVRRVLNRPAKPTTPAVERLALVARAAAESLGQRLPFSQTGGVCDGNILQDEGLATIDTLGVRGGGLHTEHEWIELDSLVERCQLMAVLLGRLSEGAHKQ